MTDDDMGDIETPFRWKADTLRALTCDSKESWVDSNSHDHGHTLCFVANSYADDLELSLVIVDMLRAFVSDEHCVLAADGGCYVHQDFTAGVCRNYQARDLLGLPQPLRLVADLEE